jgi:RNA polymerase sigma-70 factor (family 1)
MSKKDPLTDDELTHLLKKDDRAAFAEIYSRYAESLAGFAASKFFNLDDARDILHDLFVRLWENRHSLDISTSLRSYLFASIRYKVVDHIRKNITRGEYKNMLEALAEPRAESIQDITEARELKQVIESSLDRLPSRTKEIYKLSRDQHHSISEIAERLGLSEQTVKNQLTIALKHLRHTIQGLGIFVLLLDLLKK